MIIIRGLLTCGLLPVFLYINSLLSICKPGKEDNKVKRLTVNVYND